MSERRTSSSSLGPALRSMALQQYDGTTDHPPSLVVSVPTYNNKSDNHQLQHQSITLKSSSTTTTTTTTNANATTNSNVSTSNPSLQNFSSNNPSSTTTIPTTNTNPSSPVISNLLVDSDDDDTELVLAGNDTNTITIDMIHTLPTFDPNSYVKTDDNNTNIRCYISNLIVPNIKSCCTIRNTSSSLSNVLQTISDFLRVQCIPYKIRCTNTTVAFHCERNSAFATFMGQSLVFVIYLWYEQPTKTNTNDSSEGITDSATTSKNTNPPTILIDVQRRRGCPLDLQCIRRSLFRDLMNIDDNNNTATACSKKNITGQSNPICSRQGMIPLELCRSIWFRSHKNNTNTASSFKENEVDTTTATVTSQDDVEEAATASVAVDDDDTKEISSTVTNTERLEVLSHYAEMLSSTNTVENHRMALECLCQHTDPTVTDVKDSTTVVQAIVCGTNENNDVTTNNIITEIRTNLLRFISMNESEFYDQLDTSIHMLSSTGCAPKNLQALALRVVFTSLNVYLSTATTKSSSSSKLSIEHDEFWYSVLETARNGIVNAKTAPCFAAISMYLIVQLLQSNIVSNESKYMIYHDILCPNNDTSHILNDVQNANDWGKLHHCRLEAISKQFMDIIITSNEMIQLQ